MEQEGCWAEAVAFRNAARKRLSSEHPAWSSERVLKAAWEATIDEFPCSPVLLSQEPGSVGGSVDGSVVEESRSESDVWRLRLLESALSKSDRGGIQDDVEWVYQNLAVEWDEIEVDTVPSPGAVALLGEAKANRPWFFQTYHAKTLPTKAKIESDGWLEADDGQIEEMAARIRDEMALNEAEV